VNRVVRLVEAEARPLEGELNPQPTSEAGYRMSTPNPSSDVQGENSESPPDPMQVRIVEALLFASSEPLGADALAAALPPGTDMEALLRDLQKRYEERGVNLVKVAGKWQFRTAKDLGFLLHKEKTEERRLSRAAIETLAIIAYHQPVTRAEIEEIRGVMVSKGTVDALMEVGWVRIRGRRRTPGRPVTYGTTHAFLTHFGLDSVSDLPGMDELKAAGFLDAAPPAGFGIPNPSDALAPDEDPYEGEEEDGDLFPPSDESEMSGKGDA
jgi:segregation and condensation protein B